MENSSPAAVSSPATAADEAITIHGAKRHFKTTRAVDGVDLSIRRGELFGLIGHNGAGKSTLFKLMLGLIPLTSGDIRFNGVAVSGRHFRAVRRKVGYLPENVVLYDNLSGLETLHFFARLKNVPSSACAMVLEQVGLRHAAHRRVREYSKGMRQRLGFAQALLGSPEILMLDEPTNGLDPEAIHMFYTTLRTLSNQGVTIVITSHILAEIQERVDRLAIMNSGHIQTMGSLTALREQLSLPLHITAQLASDSSHALHTLQAQLQQPETVINSEQPGIISITCPRPMKMTVLGALQSLGSELTDLSIREPSLEDMFFGLSD